MKCAVCNKTLKENARFCGNCGAAIKADLVNDYTDQSNLKVSRQKVNILAKVEKMSIKKTLIPIAIVLIATIYFINNPASFKSNNSDYNRMLFVNNKDLSIFLIDKDEAIALTDGFSIEHYANEIVIADSSHIYIQKDSKSQNLSVFNSKGKETEIDDYVVYDSLKLYDNKLWYLKEDNNNTTIHYYSKGKSTQVSDDIDSFADIFSPTNKDSAYYITCESDGSDKTLYLAKNKNNEEIYDKDDCDLNLFQNDEGTTILHKMDYDKDYATLYLLDGKKLNELADNIMYMGETFGKYLLYDNTHGESMLLSANGDMVRLAEDTNIRTLSYDEKKDILYYFEGDDLYKIKLGSNLKKAKPETVCKNADYRTTQFSYNHEKLYFGNKDELVIINLKTNREKIIKLDNDITNIYPQSISTSKDHCLFKNTESSLYLYNGSKVVLIEEDAKDIDSVHSIFGDSKLIWLDNDKLIMANQNGKGQEKIAKDIISYSILDKDTVYIWNDDDELLYLTKNGKTTEVLSDIASYQIESYEE